MQNPPQMITGREKAKLICDHNKITEALSEVREFEHVLKVELRSENEKACKVVSMIGMTACSAWNRFQKKKSFEPFSESSYAEAWR